MYEKNKIPTLSISEIGAYHNHIIDWMPVVSNLKYKDYHINRLDVILNKSDFTVQPHRKTQHDFLFLTKGTSSRSKGLNTYELQGPCICFVPAYEITEHREMSEDAEGFYCQFDESLFDLLPKKYLSEQYPFFQLQSDPVVGVSEETKGNIVNILERILALYKSGGHTDKNIVAFYLLSLFEEVSKEITIDANKKIKSYLRITESYKQLLAKNIYKYQQISDYADLLNITTDYLNKCVKSSMNKTAQDLLKEMIVLEAKTLIRYSDLNLSEIAVKLCNQTSSNFSRFFKNQTGVTPMEYLKSA